MHKRWRMELGLSAALFGVSGCATFTVASNASETPNGVNGNETVHGSLYGWRWSEFNEQKCDDGPLAKVEHTFTLYHLLVTTVTLGLYAPQTVEWWCDDAGFDESDDEDEEEFQPAGHDGGASAGDPDEARP